MGLRTVGGSEMIIKKVNDGWYIGRHAGLTFFARTRSDLYRKFWEHQKAQKVCVA